MENTQNMRTTSNNAESVGATETHQHKFEVIDNSIYGQRNETNKLYMIVWSRIANHGFIYCWAESESDAFALYGYNADYVKHTIVEINPESMPVEVGLAG